MKKKGLIISTIVMVLVLAASLTTATYAWFSVSDAATIQNITVSVAAGSDVLIGVTTTGSYITGATNDNFVSGDLVALVEGVSTAWSSADESIGMTSNVQTNLLLDAIEMATATGTVDSGVDATQWSSNTNMIKAEGEGTVVTAGTIVEALENVDYLHFTLGVIPNKTTVDTITLHVTVNPTDAKTTLGMTSAMHLVYKVNNEETWHNIDLYSEPELDAHRTTAKTTVSSASTLGLAVGDTAITGAPTVMNAGWLDYEISWGETNTPIGTEASSITQIEMYIYYDGTDSDCVSAATGSSADVYFTVLNTTFGE